MNILVTTEGYFPILGGVPVVTTYLCEGLVKEGNNVSVVTISSKGIPQYECINGVNIYRFNISKNMLKIYRGEINNYISFILNFRCDVLINVCTECITTDLLLPHLNKICAKKILHSHGFAGLTLKPFSLRSDLKHTIGNTYNWIRLNFYYRSILNKYIKEYNLCLCLSEVDSSRKYLEDKSNKLQILENAADDIFFCKSDYNPLDKYSDLKNDKYFISVANYSEVKNQVSILTEYFKSEIVDHSMVFIGRENNYYYYKLIELFEDLQIKYGKRDVHFLYNVNRDDVPFILEHASLYLVASTFEEYSISIIEAMAKGVPFISTDVGNAKVLPGGIVISKLSDMSEMIIELCRNNELYASLSSKGFNYASKKCRKDVAVHKLINYIESI